MFFLPLPLLPSLQYPPNPPKPTTIHCSPHLISPYQPIHHSTRHTSSPCTTLQDTSLKLFHCTDFPPLPNLIALGQPLPTSHFIPPYSNFFFSLYSTLLCYPCYCILVHCTPPIILSLFSQPHYTPCT